MGGTCSALLPFDLKARARAVEISIFTMPQVAETLPAQQPSPVMELETPPPDEHRTGVYFTAILSVLFPIVLCNLSVQNAIPNDVRYNGQRALFTAQTLTYYLRVVAIVDRLGLENQPLETCDRHGGSVVHSCDPEVTMDGKRAKITVKTKINCPSSHHNQNNSKARYKLLYYLLMRDGSSVCHLSTLRSMRIYQSKRGKGKSSQILQEASPATSSASTIQSPASPSFFSQASPQLYSPITTPFYNIPVSSSNLVFNPALLEIFSRPTVFSITPVSGSISGDDQVEIFGTAFTDTTYQVWFGTEMVIADRVNDTVLSCRTPPINFTHTSRIVPVFVNEQPRGGAFVVSFEYKD